jgi:hypothetical protein
MDWIDLAQNSDKWRDFVNTVMHIRVPYNVRKFSSSCTTGSSSGRAQFHAVIVNPRCFVMKHNNAMLKYGKVVWSESRRGLDWSLHLLTAYSLTICDYALYISDTHTD